MNLGNALSSFVSPREVLVEDDNGRYFSVWVEAVDTQDARGRVAYILDDTAARIVRPRSTEK